ncbi:MAG TPA: D-TA family PLP-dependent enzyme [Terriglobales bacterium]|nr:D-TA family PLP-dependent enzyme [Terriglobales bacterium]
MEEPVDMDISLPEIPFYRIAPTENLMTPALAIYMDAVESNIETTLALLGGKPERWRPHVKTAKLAAVMSRLTARGVRNFKCATTLELLTVCEAGARDVIVAYPTLGARALRVQQIAHQFPDVDVSVLVESEEEIELWRGSPVSIFIDVNPGMNRTGLTQDSVGEIVRLAARAQRAGLHFRGLHYYDGHHRDADLEQRKAAAYEGYDRLLQIAEALRSVATPVEEVITSGTPAFPCALTYPGFQTAAFKHTMSPGTVVYCDLDSLSQLPREWGYRPAALVLTTVVSLPKPGIVTCDAGHKTVSADAGFPNCAVLGHPELTPQRPSEEHLPLSVAPGYSSPARGATLYLVPKHVCPTVNNFDHAILVSHGQITQATKVDARGRETPVLA